MVEPDAVEIRVLGCLLEKQRTTPDAYPLTLNALRLACNQTTNRDPIVDYDEAVIRDALARLGQRRWTRAASGAGSRAAKYRQLFDEALGLGRGEAALLTVLMLRGAQTPGELKGRAHRMSSFASLGEVDEALETLSGRALVERLGRRAGEKQERWRQLVGGVDEEGGDEGSPAGSDGGGAKVAPSRISADAGVSGDSDEMRERVERLEREVSALRDELRAIRDDLGG